MTGGRVAQGVLQTKLDKNALPKEVPRVGGNPESQTMMDPVSLEGEQLALHDIITAIHSVHSSLEARNDLDMTEVTLMWADLRNMGAHRREVVDSYAALKVAKMALKAQVSELHTTTKALEARGL
ncbi:hypothetical protein NDU88_002844 [Pleurodeles waltl]|uniref:Uncharacterized protein n=1 Tax=Pleurodeles waltl TaxID=8319 RepID=A0AAV7TMT4_PLEWA|nr:hypothetical protein NDU88_002844 [Pleurodeles waltl]